MASSTHELLSAQCPEPSAAEPVCQVLVAGAHSLLILLDQWVQQPKGVWEMVPGEPQGEGGNDLHLLLLLQHPP